MSVSFVKRFSDNQDSTSITYRKFSDNSTDTYPTFSVCFEGTNFHWIYDLDIFNSFELSTEQYVKMLKGNTAFRYEYDLSLGLFGKIPTFLNNGSNTAYNQFHVKLSDFLVAANFTTLIDTQAHFFANRVEHNVHEIPFNISYQSPDMICFARDSTYVQNLIRIEDVLTFDRNVMENNMYSKNTEMRIYIHHPGQLIRSLAIPSFTSSFADYQSTKLLSFKMSQSTIIRKRSNCNSNIHDYDMYLLAQVMNKTQCVPPYWMDIIKDDRGLEMCTSQHKLRLADREIRNWKNLMRSYDSPCTDMYNIVGWNWVDVEGTKNSDTIQIKFYYQEQYYQQLRYLPDFDVETFISNIGGFVGIFLGFSMMQIPDLIGKININQFLYCQKPTCIYFLLVPFPCF